VLENGVVVGRIFVSPSADAAELRERSLPAIQFR